MFATSPLWMASLREHAHSGRKHGVSLLVQWITNIKSQNILQQFTDYWQNHKQWNIMDNQVSRKKTTNNSCNRQELPHNYFFTKHFKWSESMQFMLRRNLVHVNQCECVLQFEFRINLSDTLMMNDKNTNLRKNCETKHFCGSLRCLIECMHALVKGTRT